MNNETAKKHVWSLGKFRRFLHSISAITSVVAILNMALGVASIQRLLVQYPIAANVGLLGLLIAAGIMFENHISKSIELLGDIIISRKGKPAKIESALWVVVFVGVSLSSFWSFSGSGAAVYQSSSISTELDKLSGLAEKLQTATAGRAQRIEAAQSKAKSSAERLRIERNVFAAETESLKPLQKAFELTSRHSQNQVGQIETVTTAVSIICGAAGLLSLLIVWVQGRLILDYVKGASTIADVMREGREKTLLFAVTQKIKRSLGAPPAVEHIEEPPAKANPNKNKEPETFESEFIDAVRKAFEKRNSINPVTAATGNAEFVAAVEKAEKEGFQIFVENGKLEIQ